MPLLDELASYLGAAGVGVVGTSIFQGMLPDSTGATADPIIGLIEYAAGPVERTHALGVASVLAERPRVQALVRGTSYATTRAKAQAIVAAFDWLGRTTLTASSGGAGTTYAQIEVLQRPPLALGRDANARWRFAVNLEAVRAPAA